MAVANPTFVIATLSVQLELLQPCYSTPPSTFAPASRQTNRCSNAATAMSCFMHATSAAALRRLGASEWAPAGVGFSDDVRRLWNPPCMHDGPHPRPSGLHCSSCRSSCSAMLFMCSTVLHSIQTHCPPVADTTPSIGDSHPLPPASTFDLSLRTFARPALDRLSVRASATSTHLLHSCTLALFAPTYCCRCPTRRPVTVLLSELSYHRYLFLLSLQHSHHISDPLSSALDSLICPLNLGLDRTHLCPRLQLPNRYTRTSQCPSLRSLPPSPQRPRATSRTTARLPRCRTSAPAAMRVR